MGFRDPLKYSVYALRLLEKPNMRQKKYVVEDEVRFHIFGEVLASLTSRSVPAPAGEDSLVKQATIITDRAITELLEQSIIIPWD